MTKTVYLLALLALASLTACGSKRGAVNVKASASTNVASLKESIVGSWAIDKALDTSTETAEEQPFISFEENGRMNGNASVNLFFGGYILGGSDSLRLDNVGMTRKLGQSMDVERAITEAINTLCRMRVEGERAYCLNEEGDTLLWLTRMKDR